jgi:uncharacterized protein HemY
MFLHNKRDVEKEYNLGRKYFKQQKYIEAEQLFRQSVQQREKALGAEHVACHHSQTSTGSKTNDQLVRVV